MVAGEDYIIGKAAEAMVVWFNKRKNEKELVHEILLSLKIGLNNIPLHMDLCKEYGCIKYLKLKVYLPSDIENLSHFLIKYQYKLDNDLYDVMIDFIRLLIDYNETINSLHLGMGEILNEQENLILGSIENLIQKINELIKKVE